MPTFKAVVWPTSSSGLDLFYIFWVVMFIFIHVIWDIVSPETEQFDLKHLRGKIDVVFSAVTFVSSVALLESLINDQLFEILNTNRYPLVITSSCGIFVSLPGISPKGR